MLLTIIRSVWKFWGSIKLSIVLCFLLALDTAIAFPIIKMNLSTFIPLGDVGLITWLTTYGRYNLWHTFWFYALMILLALLSVNTFVCATDKLFKSFKQFGDSMNRFQWFLKLGPHVMHYAVLIILTGYLGSYALSVSMPGRSLAPEGLPIKLPYGQGEVRLEKLNSKVYRGTRLDFFNEWYLDPGYDLIFTDPEANEMRKRFAYGKSPSFKGYRFYLNDFYPKRADGGSMGLNYTKISIRKDPSSHIYMGGLLIFFIGLIMYSFDTFVKRKSKKGKMVKIQVLPLDKREYADIVRKIASPLKEEVLLNKISNDKNDLNVRNDENISDSANSEKSKNG
jgi:cytochrome c biogenesis protein ResB